MPELPASQSQSSSWLDVAVVPRASCVVGRCLLVAAPGRLPARRCGAVHDCLVVDEVLGDNIMWLLERASEEAALFTLLHALFSATR
jgi:hypothetical protein